MFAPENILVPTDFSEFSDKALAEAADIGKQYGAKITLLHVVGIIQQCSVDYCLGADTITTLREQTIESAREQMQEEIRRVPSAGGVPLTVDVKEGVPYQEILREQETKKMDLIVIASHGKTGLLSHFGSVADKVARSATCRVLIVKPE